MFHCVCKWTTESSMDEIKERRENTAFSRWVYQRSIELIIPGSGEVAVSKDIIAML